MCHLMWWGIPAGNQAKFSCTVTYHDPKAGLELGRKNPTTDSEAPFLVWPFRSIPSLLGALLLGDGYNCDGTV